jgi:hypothetical protein
MKRNVMIFLVVVCAIAAYFLFLKKSPKETLEEKAATPLVAKTNTAFENAYGDFLKAYDQLKTALVETDAGKAKTAAENLIELAGTVSVDDIEGDNEGLLHETATSFKNLVVENAKLIAQTNDIEVQRTQFENVSENLWALTRTVKFGGEQVYLQHCPMAFNDRGANWVSLSSEVLNPYFGNKMLKCGVVKDSIK